MEDDPSVFGKLREHGDRLFVCSARMDDERLAQAHRERSLGAKELQLPAARVTRRGCVVEAGLTHGDRFRVGEELLKLLDVPLLHFPGLMRMEAESREHALVPLGDLEGRATRIE